MLTQFLTRRFQILFYFNHVFQKCLVLDKDLSEVDTYLIFIGSLHKKLSFPLRISSVNVTISAVSCGFGHIYWRNFQWKTLYICAPVAPFPCSNLWLEVNPFSLSFRWANTVELNSILFTLSPFPSPWANQTSLTIFNVYSVWRLFSSSV